MEVTEKVFKIFGKETYFDTWCFIFDTQMKSGGGIMKGFKSFLHDNGDGNFYIGDGWDVLQEFDCIVDKGDFEFESIPFKEVLKNAIDIFANYHIDGEEVGIRPTTKN